MKSVAFLSLLSLTAATLLDRADTSCAAPVVSTITVAAAAAASGAASLSVCSGQPATVTSTVTVSSAAAASSAAAVVTSAAPAASSAAGVNVQKFTGTLGGPPPPVISGTGDRPFSVKGNTFTGAGAAIGRSCDVQHNACANAANSGSLAGGTAQCETQSAECKAANNLRKRDGFHVVRR